MRILILALLLVLSTPLIAAEGDDVFVLKKRVAELQMQHDALLKHNEEISNYRLAHLQSKLLIKTISYEIYIYLRKQGVKRSLANIENILSASYSCSWIFTDLGKDHIDRFIKIVQWPKDESGFQPSLVSHWKAGTYLRSINKTVLKDTNDYGAFQINECHLKALKHINFLYDGGVINIKVKRIKTLKDLMDINTNCVSRCIIEVDRKARGWEWQHTGDKAFKKFLISKIAQLENQHLYNRKFVEKYYFITPIKLYSTDNFSF